MDRSDVQRAVLDRLGEAPATLAGLRTAFPDGSAAARALPSMGEEDPFAAEVAALVREGVVVDEGGRYRLRGGDAGAS